MLDLFQEEYQQALQGFLEESNEDALNGAYELGRRKLEIGIGILEIISVHHDALAIALHDVPPGEKWQAVQNAQSFLIECLSPFEMSHRAAAEANRTLRRLNQVFEEEARRVAHALHDEAGGILASARIELDLATRNLPQDILTRVDQVRQLLDDTGEQLRHLSHELRPAILDDLGLRPALEYLARGVSERTGVSVSVHGDFAKRLPPAIEIAVYRAVQEALNNAARHGGDKSEASVQLSQRNSQLRCIIQDNGAGFIVTSVLADKSNSSLGISGMRERVHAVGGSIKIESRPGLGTNIELIIPFQEKECP